MPWRAEMQDKSPSELVRLVNDLGRAVKQEERFHKILDGLNEGFLIMGFDWRYVYVNKMASVYSRIPIHEMIGYTLQEKFPGIEQTNLYREMEICMKERKSIRFENRFVYDDLSVRWFEVCLQPVDEGLSMMLTDISVRRYREFQMDRTKDLLLRKIESRTSQLECSNSELKDSIMYARQIQKAFMPPVSDLHKYFPDTFVFLQPKDLVSGDFFWVSRKRNKTVLAVVDCTGHGVPGALLSIIGAQVLCDSIGTSNDPSEILATVNNRMRRALRQSDEPSSTRDGMDICLCVFDNDFSKLTFAGANRPLYVVRVNGQTLEEIKGTRAAIGGWTENDTVFESHTVKLESGDCIYMSSDGFADQDGGEQGKKLKTKNFKSLLESTSGSDMIEQRRNLKDFFLRWKEGREQLDDVIVVGVRI